ncbi:hypothetical protein H8E77_07440, partial [bacterium]|nr:hypothetical protein [bacterium]
MRRSSILKRVIPFRCDPDGVIWFGTDGGVSRYDGKKFITFTQEDAEKIEMAFENLIINACESMEDSGGVLTSQQPLLIFNDSNRRVYNA